MLARHHEPHRSTRVNWLRAAVLGANDGTISVSGLVVGVAAAGTAIDHILITGVAGMIAGAISMAAGEYVSVQSQADTERADIEQEKQELLAEPERELVELTAIYKSRGLTAALAKQVAEQLMAKDAVGAHARDELGITDTLRARPVQAAVASAASFVTGALVPILVVMLASEARIVETLILTALIALAVLGATAAYIGGASMIKGAVRVVFWGAFAMGLTTLVGRLFGAAP